ncbi:MAG TPA: 16S rRNA (guanine(966)-N(2))-methyltransferase RsmD [Vicinamibacterales bacterium]|nr:16S rRNA (guanine(966)-N(2))-methyltransferase RsmD [Vicinamibacterales bacterium]
MRVIAGELKGRRLEAPKWPGLRPTSDKLRETLFNVLAPRMAGARVVDGFAGSGALGIEALSRGAVHATFIERDPRALKLIRANVERCGLGPEQYAIIRADFLAGRASVGAAADLVLLDPPYDLTDLDAVLAASAGLLRPGGAVVLEHARRRESPARAATLQRVRVLTSGDSALSFYEFP